MITQTISMMVLAHTRYKYPPHLELLVNDDFLAIDHIMQSGEVYVIQCQHRTWTFESRDTVQVRYREAQS